MASVAFIVLGQTSDVDERHQRKALLRQEIAAPVLRSDPLAELRHAAEELHLPPEEVSEVISASRAAMAPQQEAKTQLSLGASVIRAAEELGLAPPQVARLRMALAGLDHRSYVHLLQMLTTASAASHASVANKVAETVTAAAKANYSAAEVASSAAAAVRALADDAATTSLPLQGLASAVEAFSAEGQAAVLAAAGGESPQTQMIITEMFQAISTTARPSFQWDSVGAHPFGSDAEVVGDAVKQQVDQLAIPDQEKREILAAALSAAAGAQEPQLKMNGSAGMEPTLAGDLLALSQAALSAGFSDREVALLKFKWQEMSFQQRAAAKRSFDALSFARHSAGLRSLQGNVSTEVALAVKAFADAGASVADQGRVAARALRAATSRNAGTAAVPAEGAAWEDHQSALEETVREAKVAGLSDQQASAMLKIMAQLSPEDLDSVAMAWAAIGGDTATTQVPDTDGEDEGPEQSRAAGPLVGSDVEGFEALEELNVVAFAALKAGVELDFVAKADSIARKMSPTQQMTTAASLLRMARAAESEGSKKVTKEEFEAVLGGA